jgi:flagellar hook-associated protein 1 FlgK
MGSQSYALTPVNAAATSQSIDPQAPPDMDIQAADGTGVNAQITSGTLAGLLQVRNVTIPGLIGDSGQPGALNQLAASLSTAVNQIVSQGSVTAGAAAGGLGLFSTPDPNHPTASASTMSVNPAMTSSQLPAFDQNGVANGVPLALGALANAAPTDLGSVGYTAFYGNTAALVGSQLNTAQSNQTLTAQTLAQAQSVRASSSGVSLNAEATNVLQFQESYQAVAKMVSTLDTLMQSLIDMIPTS